MTTVDIEDELRATRPLSVTSKEDIDKMRAQAVNKLRAVSSSGAAKMFAIEGNDRRPDDDGYRELELQ